ncbi:hypothetical protein AN641_07605 [Candidatus Epulonipiscioides gigas]|nr:hypothetical protein AN641_07605 [Epulopiscium sp. SCG-C07WGA-EpuloA2]
MRIPYDAVLEGVIILKINYEGIIIYSNDYAQKKLGLDKNRLQTLQNIIFSNNYGTPEQFLRQFIKIDNKTNCNITFKDNTGELITTVCTIEKNKNNKEIDLSAVDVTKYDLISRKNKLYYHLLDTVHLLSDKYLLEQQHLSFLYDTVTGSPNKNYFIKYFEEYKGNNLVFIYLDADNFKSINDSFGRSFGDAVLKEIIKRVNNIKDINYIIGRFYADEFLILIEDFDTMEKINDFMELLSNIFDIPFTNNGISFGVSYSAGISLYPRDGKDFEDLLNNADLAMHRAKAEGKRNFIFYEPQFRQTILEKIYMESDLRKGITNNEFSLYYQPQVDMLTNEVCGFEALIRWLKPDGRIIPPFKFITSAEETGLMIPMGAWVIEEACKFINKLNNIGYHDIYIAVNISAVQIAQKNFVSEFIEIIERTKVNTKQLHLEITETVLMKDIEVNTAKIRELQNMGMIIALDDFGTGYSSLTYLKQLPINILKMDKSFVDEIGSGKKNLVRSIINLGHDLELKVVAEGVEDKAQLDYLSYYNCDILQGYIVSKPIPENQAIEFLKKPIKFK